MANCFWKSNDNRCQIKHFEKKRVKKGKFKLRKVPYGRSTFCVV